MVLKLKRVIEHLQIYMYTYAHRVCYSLFSEESATPCHIINYK